MSKNGTTAFKRKVEVYQDEEVEEGRRAIKEAKMDTPGKGQLPCNSVLAVRRLLPEDWSLAAASTKEEDDSGTDSGEGLVSRGTTWSGNDVCQETPGTSSQLYIACNRTANESSFDCETQTYYFVPSLPSERDKVSKDKDLVRKCCVIGCKYQSEDNSLISYHELPSNKVERAQWEDILGLKFMTVPEGDIQEICSNHFDVSVGSQSSVVKVTPAPKLKTRKKRTCDILIAEEAEKVKQSMTTGRSKRTPKPNRNYDWAELMPVMKNEVDSIEEEAVVPKSPSKNTTGPGRRRKQTLGDKREEKENERPFMDSRMNIGNEMAMSDSETEDYDYSTISLPSEPRAPPPKPKGRPHRIQDTSTQTVCGTSSSPRGPLREVKVQCNLTAERLVNCSSCSNFDWKSLDKELSCMISVVECEVTDPILSRCLINALSDHVVPSHATNVLKMIAGLPRDEFEDNDSIAIVPDEHELEEVEIENFIHHEEAPVVGIREITAKEWIKKEKDVGDVHIKVEESIFGDADSFGLKEATDRFDDEFKPDDAELKDQDDNEEDLEDDEEDEKGSPKKKKKRKRYKAKKDYTLKAESEQGSSHTNDMKKGDTNNSSDGGKEQQTRRCRRGEGDTRWIRQEHKCDKCNVVFSTRRKYDLHYSHIHLGVAPWQGEHKCEDCGRVFTQKVSLKVHRMFKHGAPRRFRCSKCTYVAPTKEYLKRHMKVHTKEGQFVCSECGKGLKSNESYRNHMVLHTNKGRFFCTLCKKAFNHKGAFTDHVNSHQENRNFVCYCGASFKVYKHVARHIRAVHLNDKRFICDICGSQHMTGFNLKNHLKKHGDDQYLPYSYQCPGCEAKFRGNQGFSTHLKVIHNKKPSEIFLEEGKCKNMLSLHPTRRPKKYNYSCTTDGSESVLSNESLEENKKSQEESILVSCDSYFFPNVKTEEVVYNVSEKELDMNPDVVYNVSERDDDMNCDVAEREVDMNHEVVYNVSEKQDVNQDGGDDFMVAGSEAEEVIHIFSCSRCNAMFSSETQCQEHMAKCH